MFASSVRLVSTALLLALAVPGAALSQTGDGRFVFPQAAVGPVPPLGRYVIDLRIANPAEDEWLGTLRLLRQSDLQPMQNLTLDGAPLADPGDVPLELDAGEARVFRIGSLAASVQVGVLVLETEGAPRRQPIVPSFTYRLSRPDGRVVDLISVPASEASRTLRAVVSRSQLESFEFGLALVRSADLSGDPAPAGEGGASDLELTLSYLDSGGTRQVREAELDFVAGQTGLQVARLLREFFNDTFEAGLLEVRSNVGPIHALLIGFGNTPDFEDIQNGVVPLFPFRLNTPPLVDAGPSRLVNLSPDGSVTVDVQGEASDPDDDPLSVTWRAVSAPAGALVAFADRNRAATAVTFDRVGSYLLRLTGNDGTDESFSEVTVRVDANRRPTVEAGPDLVLFLTASGEVQVTLGATASDPDGHDLAANWIVLARPAAGTIVFNERQRLDPTVTLLRAGTYQLRLFASDGELDDADELTITVNPNRPPVVSAGPDVNTALDAMGRAVVALTGSVSDDEPGLTILWSRVSGPATVTFANAASPETTATFTATGAYRLRLTAGDGQFEVNDEVVVTVQGQNQAPTVDAGPDQTVGVGPDGTATVQLMGTAGDDGLPAGSVLLVQWSQFRGPSGVTFTDRNRAETSARLPGLGVYTLRLTASDGALISTDRVTITVVAGNQPPAVNAGADRTASLTAAGNVTLQLEGSVTDDGLPSPPSLTAQWTRVSGPAPVTFANAGLPTTTATFTAAGTYVLRLSASDGERTASDDVTVTVAPGNQAPSVNAGADQVVTLRAVGSVTLGLSGTATDDGLPAPPSLTVQWILGIGPAPVTFSAPNSLDTSVTFTVSGTYVIRLRVTDGELTSTDEVVVTVQPNQAPIVDAGGDQTVNLGMSGSVTVILDGRATDTEGDVLTVQWSVVEAPAGATVTFANANARSTTATITAVGVYRLRLTASDGALTASDDAIITVN